MNSLETFFALKKHSSIPSKTLDFEFIVKEKLLSKKKLYNTIKLLKNTKKINLIFFNIKYQITNSTKNLKLLDKILIYNIYYSLS